MGKRGQEFGDPPDFEKEITEPVITVTATIHQNLPEQVVEVLEKNNLRIKLDKIHANRLFDQRPGMVAKDGCISSPSGPSC
jgi:hypothetical protein